MLIAHGYEHPGAVPEYWKGVDLLKSLRHTFTSKGSNAARIAATAAAMTNAVMRNLDHGFKISDEYARLEFLDSCVISIAASRWERWAYTQTTATKLNGIQRRLIAILWQIRPRPGEPHEAFYQRRHDITTRLARRAGLFSRKWERSISARHAHLDRSSDSQLWAQHLLRWRGSAWLEARRVRHPTHVSTNTRACPGRPYTRWDDGFLRLPPQDRRT